MRHGKGVWRLIQVGNGCKDWDNDTKHDQHIPRRERLGYGCRCISYCTVAKDLMETRPTKDSFNVSKDTYKQYKQKFKRVILKYTEANATKDPNKRRAKTEAEKLAAMGFDGKKNKLDVNETKRARGKSKADLEDRAFEEYLAPDEDQAMSNIKTGKIGQVLPKRTKVVLLHKLATQLAQELSTEQDKEKRSELLKELWQVETFVEEVDDSAAWPQEITAQVGEEMEAYKIQVSHQELVSDDLGPGWEKVENMVGELVWARIGTAGNSLDAYWWAAIVVGRSPVEKGSQPKHRKVSFFGENSTSTVLASNKYLKPFTKERLKQDSKARLPPPQQQDWEYGFMLACQHLDGPEVGGRVVVRFLEGGVENWYCAEVKEITTDAKGTKMLKVSFDDGDEDELQYPDPDVMLEQPAMTKGKRVSAPREKHVVKRKRPALEAMNAGFERGGETQLRDFMARHGLSAEAGALVEHGVTELEDLLADFTRGYDIRHENGFGTFLEQILASGLDDKQSRSVLYALRVEQQMRLCKAMYT